jgi:ABC-type polysaccharide/polyol phosphate export permease
MTKNYYLIRKLAITDFKLRYNNSVLGYLWSLLNPLLIFGTLYLVFSVFMRFDGIQHYQLYLLLGIILWGFFTEATLGGMNSLLGKANLIKNIKFSIVNIPFAHILTNLVTLFLNLVVFSLFFLFAGIKIHLAVLLFPLYLIQLLMISSGVALFLSSYYVKYRDLNHLWGVFLQIGFWLTPIIYPTYLVPDKLSWLTSLNPLARIITDSRNALIYNSIPALRHILVTFVMAIAVFMAGFYIFKKRAPYFIEDL